MKSSTSWETKNKSEESKVIVETIQVIIGTVHGHK